MPKKLSKAKILYAIVWPHANKPDDGITIDAITALANETGYAWNSYFVSRIIVASDLFAVADNRDYSKSKQGSKCYYAKDI